MIINEDGSRLPTVTQDAILGFFGDYRYLSNYHICPVTIERITYGSSEAAYMAQKTDDLDTQMLFSVISPPEAKKLGQKIALRDDWELVKVKAMKRCLLAKFSQNKDIQDKLLSTYEKYLEETNNWNDRFWGVCDSSGLNMLGKTLMSVRETLQRTLR